MNNNNIFAALFVVDDFSAGANINSTTASAIGLNNAGATIDNGSRWKIRTWNMLHQLVHRQVGITQQCQTAADHFREVVRRDIGRHTHSDTGGTIHQQGRNSGREYRGNSFSTVIIVDKINGLFIEVCQHLMRDFLHPNFGVTHGCRIIAVYGAEITLAVHHQVAHGERLSHAHDGVVNR